MKLANKVESLVPLNGEPNLIPPDNSNGESDNFYIVNIFQNLLKQTDNNLDCVGAEVAEGEVNVFITDGEKVVSLNFFDEDGVPYMSISDLDEEDVESEEEEIEAFDLSEYGVWDGSNFDFTKLDAGILDLFAEEQDPSDDVPLAEAFLTVIRKGKKVKKKLRRKKRKKVLSGKRKMAIRRGVMKRKRTQRQALRKRKKSLAIRNRSKLKRKPKNYRV